MSNCDSWPVVGAKREREELGAPCELTRAELIELRRGPTSGLDFFTLRDRSSISKKLSRVLETWTEDELDDGVPRCTTCGHTISEHPQPASTTSPTKLQWDTTLYTDIASADLRASELARAAGIQLLECSSSWCEKGQVFPTNLLMVREWHRKLWATYSTELASEHLLVIIGTPGVGKSMGLNYVLFQYLQAAQAKDKTL